MEKKRGRSSKVNKKKGKPAKIVKIEKWEEEEEEDDDNHDLETNSSDGNVSSLGPASTSLDALTNSRRQTRNAKALADQKAALNTSSGSPAENSTLLLVKQILFDANKSDTANNAPVEAVPSNSPTQAQDLHSQHENISPDKSEGTQDGTTVSSKTENQPVPLKNGLDLKKFTSDLLSQTQQPELPVEVASSCSDEIMVNNNPPEREEVNVVSNRPEDTANKNAQSCEHPARSSTHSIPKVADVDSKSSENNSKPGNPFVDVGGYKVKQELGPLLTAIFSKYGDIAKDSTFSMESRSCLLEMVCSICKRLEASTLMQLTPIELQSMLSQIRDLELVKVEVGWLHKRLNQLSKARQMYDGVSTLKDVEARSVLVIDEKKKAVETSEKEIQATLAAFSKSEARLKQEKDELAATLAVADEIKNFYDVSLVHGLI